MGLKLIIPTLLVLFAFSGLPTLARPLEEQEMPPERSIAPVPVLIAEDTARSLQLPLVFSNTAKPFPKIIRQALHRQGVALLQVEDTFRSGESGTVTLSLSGNLDRTDLARVLAEGALSEDDSLYLTFAASVDPLDEKTARLTFGFGSGRKGAPAYPLYYAGKVSQWVASGEENLWLKICGSLTQPRKPQVVLLLHNRSPAPVPRIALYAGKGAWEQGNASIINFLDRYGIEWEAITELDIDSGRLDNHRYDAVWFGGGFSAEYRYYIKDHGAVRSFVEKGGAFIGICAGAYYAADVMVWQGKLYHYPLGLFNGRGIGPISSHLRWGDRTEVVLNQEWEFNRGFPSTLEMYYFDGPYFEPAPEQPVEILAEYPFNGKPAAIGFEYGRGKVLLLGIHPELGYSRSTGFLDLHGGSGAQWPWLYEALRWLLR